MEPLDQAIADALSESCLPAADDLSGRPAKILVVGCDADVRKTITKAVVGRKHRCTCVPCSTDACSALGRTSYDVIVLNCRLPEGDGMELAPLVHKNSPFTKIIAISDDASATVAVHAMRCGASDLIHLPIEIGEFARRFDIALVKSRLERQRDERLARLKKICRELNVARHEISKQVDTLCNDLVCAYQDMAEQISEVAMASEFRTLLRQELDVEDLLRTTLEYLLTKTGPTNAAVFLPDCRGTDRRYGLGAYVNCDCPRETVSVLLDHLGHAICPQMAQEPDIVSFADAKEFAAWIGRDAGILADSQVLAFSCLHEEECLAVIVLFRNKTKPFDEALAGVLDILREIIAEQLSHVIHIHHRAKPSWPKDAEEGNVDFKDDLGSGSEGGLAA